MGNGLIPAPVITRYEDAKRDYDRDAGRGKNGTGSTKAGTRTAGSTTAGTRQAGSTTTGTKRAGSTKILAKKPISKVTAARRAGSTTTLKKKAVEVTDSTNVYLGTNGRVVGRVEVFKPKNLEFKL